MNKQRPKKPMNLLEFFKDGYGLKQWNDGSVRRWEIISGVSALLVYAFVINTFNWRSWESAGWIFYGIATTLMIIYIVLIPYFGYRLSCLFRKK